MKKILVAIFALSLLIGSTIMAAEPEVTALQTKTFPDVTDGHWARENISRLTDLGIIDGYPDGTFKPSGTVTLAQFTKMLMVAIGEEVELPSSGEKWYKPYIDRAKSLGMMPNEYYNLTDFDFNVDREAMAQMAVRAVAKTEGAVTMASSEEALKGAIADINWTKEDYMTEVLMSYGAGIITGYPDGSFKPMGYLNRAEAATVIIRVIDPQEREPKIVDVPFDDENYPIAKNAEMGMQRTSFTTATFARNNETMGVLDQSKKVEVVAPVVDGVQRTELFDTLILWDSYVYNKYFDETYDAITGNFNFIDYKGEAKNHPVFNTFPNGYSTAIGLDDRHGRDHVDFRAYITGYSDLWTLANTTLSINSMPYLIYTNLSTEGENRSVFYKTYAGHQAYISSLNAAYEMNVISMTGMNDNMTEDFLAFIDIVFEEDAVHVRRVLNNMIGSDVTYESRIDYMKTHGFETTNTGYYLGVELPSRYYSIDVYGNEMDVRVSYLK